MFQLQAVSNVMILVNQNFAVNNLGVSCLTRLTLIFDLKMKIQHTRMRFKMATFSQFIYCFSPSNQNETVG